MLLVEILFKFRKLIQVPVSLAKPLARVSKFARRRAAAAGTKPGPAATISAETETKKRKAQILVDKMVR